MQVLNRSTVKVGTFFVALIVLFIGSSIYAPVAQATGEYYQYFPADGTIRVTGGVLAIPASLQRTGPASFEGGITVAGAIARIPTGNDPATDPKMQGTCPYNLRVTEIVGDLNLPGNQNGAHAAKAGFPNSGVTFGTNQGDCRPGEIGNLDALDMQALIGLNIVVSSTADPRGDTGGQACPGSNAGAGTICADIPPGCPGSTSTAPVPDPAPTGDQCPYQAVAPGEDVEEPDICPIEKTTALRWIACPIVAGGEALTGMLDSTINYFLTINTTKVFGDATGKDTTPDPGSNDQSTGFYSAWSTFRNFGIGLVVIAGLIMVASEALGLQIVDAYTVRKTLPRLFIAVIGIALSWSLMYFLITFFNRLGLGMSSIIYSSFGDVGATAKANIGTVIFTQYFGLFGGLLALGVLGMLSFLATLALALLVGIAVLILREGIILMCVIIAPLAIASYVLPNTAKFASFWWNTFIKALMAFPIITGFIAICKVMSILTKNI